MWTVQGKNTKKNSGQSLEIILAKGSGEANYT
jgi:hypothetical protein